MTTVWLGVVLVAAHGPHGVCVLLACLVYLSCVWVCVCVFAHLRCIC